MSRLPLPPFVEQTAIEKVRLAEDGWNTRDPAKVALAYSTDSQWRNRAEFLSGREAYSQPMRNTIFPGLEGRRGVSMPEMPLCLSRTPTCSGLLPIHPPGLIVFFNRVLHHLSLRLTIWRTNSLRASLSARYPSVE
jgi:Protein of unknown function (DUF1348)